MANQNAGVKPGRKPDEEAARPQEIARVALGARIDFGHRKPAAAEMARDFGGVDAVVLRLGARLRYLLAP